MERRKPFDGFQFDEQLPLKQQVGPKTLRQLDTIIFDRNRFLALDQNSAPPQLIGQNRLIRRF